MANKRIRSRRPQETEDILAGLDLPTPKKQRQTTRRASEISEEIHRLECVIAAAPTMQRQRALSRRDTLPPLEDSRTPSRRRHSPAPLPLNARRLRSQQRLMQGAQLLIILVAIAGVAGWMKQWLQW
jgi:hypothetical protein